MQVSIDEAHKAGRRGSIAVESVTQAHVTLVLSVTSVMVSLFGHGWAGNDFDKAR